MMHVENAVDGLGGCSAELETALTNHEATGREREREREKVQRTAKCYDGDGHGFDLGLRPLLLAAITAVAPNDKEEGHVAKIIAARRRAKPGGYGSAWCAPSLLCMNNA